MRFSDGTDRWGQGRAELRLRVLHSLPPRHQRYLFEEIRKLCRDFLRSKRVPLSEITPEELLSEIWQKLLGTMSVHDEGTRGLPFPDPNQVSIDDGAPERDGRVAWLIDQIGGNEAMTHRREDIMRRRFGRASTENGRRLVQARSDGEFAEILVDAEAPNALGATDGRRIWHGLLATAYLWFQQSDDASKLLRLLADNPDILLDSPGGHWPMTQLVTKLNDRFSPPPWTRDRADNAKRRLVKWIKRLKSNNGLDDVDLEALFARVAREQERRGQTSPTRMYHHLTPQN
jgi:hypothetical protein